MERHTGADISRATWSLLAAAAVVLFGATLRNAMLDPVFGQPLEPVEVLYVALAAAGGLLVWWIHGSAPFRAGGRAVWQAAGLAVVWLVATAAGFLALHVLLTGFRPDPAPAPWLVAGLPAALLTGLWEEFLFRGLVLNGLRPIFAPGRAGFWAANVAQAGFFTYAHTWFLSYPGVAGALDLAAVLAGGLILGWAFDRARSLAAPVVAHALTPVIAWLVLRGDAAVLAAATASAGG